MVPTGRQEGRGRVCVRNDGPGGGVSKVSGRWGVCGCMRGGWNGAWRGLGKMPMTLGSGATTLPLAFARFIH